MVHNVTILYVLRPCTGTDLTLKSENILLVDLKHVKAIKYYKDRASSSIPVSDPEASDGGK